MQPKNCYTCSVVCLLVTSDRDAILGCAIVGAQGSYRVLSGVQIPPSKRVLWGNNIWACPDLSAVNILIFIRKGQQRCCLWPAVI